MKIYLIALIATLMSSISLASLDVSFVSVSSEYSTRKDEVDLPNMPRVRSQDSLGICFGFSSQVVMQAWECKATGVDCKNLPPKKEISPLDLVRWTAPDPNATGGSVEDHSTFKEGGFGSNILSYFTEDRYNFVSPESCYPFDQFANRYGMNNTVVQQIVGKLEKEYNKSKTEAGACIDCIKEVLNKQMNIKADAELIQAGLQAKTFGSFWQAMMFDQCRDKPIKLSKNPVSNYFPEPTANGSAKKVSTSELIAKGKEILKGGNPFLVDGICPQYRNGKCIEPHSVAVTGYRKVCKSDGSCRDLFKVQNSWGADWQRRNNDGWLDAESFLNHKDSSVPPIILGWLSERA